MSDSADQNPVRKRQQIFISFFSNLWDELVRGQDVRGPYGTVFSLATHPVSFINRICSRRESRYLQSAARCNATFYPVIIADVEGEEAAALVQSLNEFHAHCR